MTKNGLIEYPDGTKRWFLNGKLHREDGPAVECNDGTKFWYLKGKKLRVKTLKGLEKAGKGPFGHLDLAGNVWEWVADFYDPYAYRRAGADRGVVGTCDEIMETLVSLKRNKMQGFTGSNPIPDECERVLRGGAFNYHAKGLRASNRVHHPGRFRLVMSGFRCARDP